MCANRIICCLILFTLLSLSIDIPIGCHLNLSLECVLLENCNFIDSGKGSVSVNNKINAKLSGFGVSKLFKEFHDGARNVKRTSFTCFKGACPSLVDDVHYVCFYVTSMNLAILLSFCHFFILQISILFPLCF